MRLLRDERGAAIQVGASILLGFVVISITLYQVEVVPDQNAEVEFEHNRQVQQQLVGLNDEVVGVADGDTGGSQSVTLGTGYPPRTIFVNPGPAAGQLRTTDAGVLRIDNATAAGEPDAVAEFWNGTEWNRTTRGIAYRPGYNVYDAAPTTLAEHGLVYNRHPNGANRTVTDQVLIDGDRITVVTVRGNLSEASTRTVSVRARAFSSSANTVSVESTADDPIRLTLPTTTPDLWNQTLRGEAAVNESTIVVGARSIEFALEPGTYSLRMAEVGVGDAQRASPTNRSAYVVPTDRQAPTVVAEVRDQFNNPVENVEVTVIGGQAAANSTGSDGRIRIENVSGGDDVTVEVDNTSISRTFTVESGGGSGSGGSGSSAYNVTWQDPSGQPGTSNCGPDACTLDAGQSRTLDLTMATDPTADGADVEYAVSDRSVGTVDPKSGVTDGSGTNATTLTAEGEGTVNVYVSSGSDGDVIEVTIQNFSFPSERVVFTRASDDELLLVSNESAPSGLNEFADVIGPLTGGLDADGADEIPFVDGNRLYVTDTNGNTQELSGPSTVKPFSGASLLAVGAWETGDDHVYFVDENEATIYRVRPGSDPQAVVTPNNGASAVVGIADVDDDGDDDLIYVDSSQALRYIDNSGQTTGTVMNDNLGQNNGGIGVGRPADFDGDGVPRVPIVNGDGNLLLVDGSGNTETVSTSTDLTKSPVAPVDWDADGETEIVFVASDGTLNYVDDVGGANTIKAASSAETPGEDAGAA